MNDPNLDSTSDHIVVSYLYWQYCKLPVLASVLWATCTGLSIVSYLYCPAPTTLPADPGVVEEVQLLLFEAPAQLLPQGGRQLLPLQLQRYRHKVNSSGGLEKRKKTRNGGGQE